MRRELEAGEIEESAPRRMRLWDDRWRRVTAPDPSCHLKIHGEMLTRTAGAIAELVVEAGLASKSWGVLLDALAEQISADFLCATQAAHKRGVERGKWIARHEADVTDTAAQTAKVLALHARIAELQLELNSMSAQFEAAMHAQYERGLRQQIAEIT